MHAVEPSLLQGWSPEVRAELGAMLRGLEPAMPPALGRYDVLAAIRYANWLQATASLRASVMESQGAEFILNTLNDPATEPRKVMAYVGSEHMAQLVVRIDKRTRYLPLVEKVGSYARQHPHNRDMREIADAFAARVAALPD